MNRKAFFGGLTPTARLSTHFDQSAVDTNDEISVDDTDPFGDGYRFDTTQTAGRYEIVDGHSRTLIVRLSALKVPVNNC